MMMKPLRLLLVLPFLFVLNSLSAQDLHYTDYRFSPFYFNPAKTGSFLGSVRAGASARDQFSTFISNPYRSFMVFADYNLPFGFKDHHWTGIGIMMYNDKAGDIGFSNSGFFISGAYHFSFDNKYDKVLTLGVQYGFAQRGTGNPKNASFGDEIQFSMTSLDRDLITEFNDNYSDLNIGVMYNARMSKYAVFQAGAAVYHVLRPRFSFKGSSVRNFVRPRINGHTSLRYYASKTFYIEPTAYISLMEKATATLFQFNTGFRTNDKSNWTFKPGLGYRFGDALSLLLGASFKDWDFGFTYDATVSSASSYTNGFGAIELGVKRIFTIKKKPKIDPVLICPRL